MKQTNKKKNRLTNIISALSGGLITAIILGLVFTNGLLPINAKEETVNDNTSKVQAQETIHINDDKDGINLTEVSKAIVGISNLQQQDVWNGNQEAGVGSGIIYKKQDGKAYVITNNHVVDGASEVTVNLDNEEPIKAKVLGTDALSDLAVLEIDGTNIEAVAKLGESEQLAVGETVFAIGNPLSMDFSGSVTKGIISGLNRPVKVDTSGNQQADWIMDVIQTDAAINPGNSGGALVNEQGEVIGINSMKIAQHAVEGIGFSIPVDTALPIVEQLETNGSVDRPFIGISMVELAQVPPQYQPEITLPENVTNGVVVAAVEANSPADEANLQQFDLITKINDEQITSILDLRKYLYSESNVNETVKLELYRDGKKVITDIQLVKQTK